AGCVITTADDAPADTDTDTDDGATSGDTQDQDSEGDSADDTGSDTDNSMCPTPPTGDEAPEMLDCGSFGEARLLSNDPSRPVDYVVVCTELVMGALTIEAGTVIEFADDAGLDIRGEGSVVAVGDECDPVVLRSVAGSSGAWRGVHVSSAAQENTLEWVEIHDAGGGAFSGNGELGGLILEPNAALAVRDSTIVGSAAFGFHGVRGPATLVWERNTIMGSAQPAAHVAGLLVHTLDSESDFTGNPGGDYVEVQGQALDAEVTWRALNVPYRVLADTSVRSTSGLTLDAGVEIHFESNAAIYADPGYLDVGGTVEQPVLLIGAESSPGAWRGVLFDNDSDNNRLSHTEIRDGGGGSFNSNGDLGAVVLWADTALTLSESTISGSAAYGLNANYGGSSLTLEGNNILTGNAGGPVLVGAYLAEAMDPATDFTGNPGGDVIQVWTGTGNVGPGTHTWRALAVPYRVGIRDDIEDQFRNVAVRDDQSLTLEAGVIVLMEQDTGFWIDGGSFAVNGTENNPVTLRGVEETPGYWRGLYFNDPGSPHKDNATHSIDYADIAHAGGAPFNSNGDLGTVIVWAGTEASITNSTLHDNAAACVINLPYTQTTLVEEGNTFSSNAGAPVCDES
ncbi:MAG: hypothetical protein JKY37_20185, partial [Nannocystaceae bacterium]|nr:hypothetical protein [Nannocystaceae bacterium]